MSVQTLEKTPEASPSAFHVKQLALLIAATVAVDTFVTAFSAEKLSFLYKNELGLAAGSFAAFGLVLNIPQYLRPFIGAWTDLFPFAGYHRRSYYFVAVLAEAVALFVLSLLKHYTCAVVALLVIVQSCGIVLMFLMVEATMIRIGNATGTTGRLQTVQQVVRYGLLTTCTAHLSGYVTQHWSYATCLRDAALITLVALPLTLMIDEKPVARRRHHEETIEEKRAREAEKKRDHENMMFALREGARSPGLWVVVGFLFYYIVTPGTSTASFYYEVDYLHFSKQLLGDLSAYSSAGSVIGFVTYALLSPYLPVRTLPIGLVVLGVIGSFLNFALINPFSAMALSFVGGILYGWTYLSILTLGARTCPPGIEGAVYGLVYASQFLGSTLSDVIGSNLYDGFGGASGHLHSGWVWLNWIGVGSSALAAVFLPFMPAWAKSSAALRAPAKAAGGLQTEEK